MKLVIFINSIVREKSKTLIELIEDREKLKEERERYSKWKSRIEGVSSSGVMSSVSSSNYNSKPFYTGSVSYLDKQEKKESTNKKKKEESSSDSEEDDKKNKKKAKKKKESSSEEEEKEPKKPQIANEESKSKLSSLTKSK